VVGEVIMRLFNPIPMQARIRECWMLAYRVPVEAVVSQVPSPLRLITRDGFAFLNVVIAGMDAMRPEGLPASLGMDYWHVGYRLHVEAQTVEGRKEGLYFLRSECDARLLGWAGNLLTQFRFHPASLEVHRGAKVGVTVESRGGGGAVVLDLQRTFERPADSIFATKEESESVLRYNPLGLAAADEQHVALLDIEHGPWSLRSMDVVSHDFAFVKAIPGATLEAAFELDAIDYHFQRGRVVEARL
jgi:uncharacterized protein YqjF (DUF2071 family)